MKFKNNTWATALMLGTLLLSSCGAKAPDAPTATPVDVNAVAQQAIATFAMGLTMTAFAQPTATFTPPPPATSTVPPFPTIAIIGTAGSSSTKAVNTCDVSLFTGIETVPDKSPMAPSQQFVKKWEVKNTGTCTWLPTYRIAYTGVGSNGNLGGQTTPIGKTVKPGETITLELPLTAPAIAGEYTSWWKLQNDKGEFFQCLCSLSIVIKVVGVAEPTATETSAP